MKSGRPSVGVVWKRILLVNSNLFKFQYVEHQSGLFLLKMFIKLINNFDSLVLVNDERTFLHEMRKKFPSSNPQFTKEFAINAK